MANTIRIKRRIELPDSVASTSPFKSMVSQGMIIVPGENTNSKLPSELFEQWWKAYPFRISNGKKIKIGKAKAKKLFDNLITDAHVYDQLMCATNNYAHICNNLPKDPERFIRADFWREYYEVPSANVTANQNTSVEIDSSSLQDMIRG